MEEFQLIRNACLSARCTSLMEPVLFLTGKCFGTVNYASVSCFHQLVAVVFGSSMSIIKLHPEITTIQFFALVSNWIKVFIRTLFQFFSEFVIPYEILICSRAFQTRLYSAPFVIYFGMLQSKCFHQNGFAAGHGWSIGCSRFQRPLFFGLHIYSFISGFDFFRTVSARHSTEHTSSSATMLKF